jgi:hypothetical protein
MQNSFQIIYPASERDENKIHSRFKKEAKAFKKLGMLVGTKPSDLADTLMYKGFIIYEKEKYPNDVRYVNGYEEYLNYMFLSKYYQHIADLTIETFFVDELDERLPVILRQKGWSKAFIKKDVKALEHIEEGKSVWPKTSLDEMRSLYEELKFKGKYAIRKFIPPELLKDEIRYWVLNGRVYRRDNIIPDIVKEAAKRLNKLGSKYYTIDATPELIVEVNPGESSDRHAENTAEIFAGWIKKEFVKDFHH